MSDDQSYELLGFDNVLLPVGDLGAAVGFYERAGFAVGFRFDEAGIALLKVGGETPGSCCGRRAIWGTGRRRGPRRVCGSRWPTRARRPARSPRRASPRST